MDDHGDRTAHHSAHPLGDEQLAAFEHGWAAIIMPVQDGWKIRYLSTSSFEEEPGTTFTEIDEALAAIREVLPAINTPEARARARREYEQRPPP